MPRPEPGSTATGAVREFAYRPRDFERLRQMLYRLTGIHLSNAKQQMVYSRLSRRLRRLALTSFEAYLDYLERHGEEHEEFVNALTTNLTAFFRERHHFQSLGEHLQGLRQQSRPLRLWCTAASTGEEPYSIAMTVAEVFDSLRPPVHILASDIDTRVLEAARQGIYPLTRIAPLSAVQQRRFLLRGKGAQAGKVRIRDELRALVEFRQINLLANTWPVEPGLDVIFCRNVMIYFDKPTQLQVLERMTRLLRPDGLFFAGHSESFAHASDLVRLIGRTLYRPVGGAAQ